MILTSKAFHDQQPIPIRYTGKGQDVSPPLEWSDVPKNAKEFVLVCEDPDAPAVSHEDGTFVHWMAYNISANTSALPEGLPANELRVKVPVSLEQGSNSFGKVGYRGPNPPAGDHPHHYKFTLYALDAELGIRPAVTRERLLKAMQGHVISSASLVGTYVA